MIQLFVKNQLVDGSVEIQLNQTIDNWQFSGYSSENTYSYTFELPYTINNNRIFYNIEEELPARVEYNDVVIFDGFCKVQELSKTYKVNLYTLTPKSIGDIFKDKKLSELEPYYVDVDNTYNFIKEQNSIKDAEICFPYLYDGIPSNLPLYNEENPTVFKEEMRYFQGSESKVGLNRIYTGWNVNEVLKRIFKDYNIKGSFYNDNLWFTGRTIDNGILPRFKANVKYTTTDLSKGKRVIVNDRDTNNWLEWSAFLENINQMAEYSITSDNFSFFDKTANNKIIKINKAGWYKIKFKLNKLQVLFDPDTNDYIDALYSEGPEKQKHFGIAGARNKVINYNPQSIINYADNGLLNNVPFELQFRRNYEVEIPNSDGSCGVYKANNLFSTLTGFRTEYPWEYFNTDGTIKWKIDVNTPTTGVVTNDDDMLLGLKWGRWSATDASQLTREAQAYAATTELRTYGVLDFYLQNRTNSWSTANLNCERTFNSTFEDKIVADLDIQNQVIFNSSSFSAFPPFKKNAESYTQLLNQTTGLTYYKEGTKSMSTIIDYGTTVQWTNYNLPYDTVEGTEVETVVYLSESDRITPVLVLPQVMKCYDWIADNKQKTTCCYVGCNLDYDIELNFINNSSDFTPTQNQDWNPKSNLLNCLPDLSVTNFLNYLKTAFNLNITTKNNNIFIDSKYSTTSQPIDISKKVTTDFTLKGYNITDYTSKPSNILFKTVDDLYNTPSLFGTTIIDGNFNRQYDETIQLNFVCPNYIGIVNHNDYTNINKGTEVFKVPAVCKNSTVNKNFLYYDTNVQSAYDTFNDIYLFKKTDKNILIKDCNLVVPETGNLIFKEDSESILTQYYNLTGLNIKQGSGQEVTKKCYIDIFLYDKIIKSGRVIIDNDLYLLAKINKLTLGTNHPTAELVLIKV